MTVYINGDALETNPGTALGDLLRLQGVDTAGRIAIAVNSQVVRRADYDSYVLAEGAQILIINPTFGG